MAFSGGVDSSLLLKIASDLLGDRVCAVTALSETLSRSQKERIEAFITTHGIRHMKIETPETGDVTFVRNDKDRCYYCKKIKFGLVMDQAARHQVSGVMDGSNQDDLKDYRPGARAIRELGVRSPFIEVGITKNEIREMARRLNLPVWDLPSDSCLATRIPYGRPITLEKLAAVEKGEAFLKDLGLMAGLRTRHYDDMIRLEIDERDFHRFSNAEFRDKVICFFKTLDFIHVALDLSGFHSGSMNSPLKLDPNQEKPP